MALQVGATRCSKLPGRYVGEDRCVVNAALKRPAVPAELFFATAAEFKLIARIIDQRAVRPSRLHHLTGHPAISLLLHCRPPEVS